MYRNKTMNWGSVVRNLKGDRLDIADIREIACTGSLKAWAVKGGARYVVSPKPRDLFPVDAVICAIARDDRGIASLVAVAAFEGESNAFPTFRALAHAGGATELQIHSLAETPADRAAMVAALAPAARIDATATAARSLATSAGYDRAAIMAAAVALVRTRQAATGEAWTACIGSALKATWAVAKAQRAAAQH